jgi:hypothetical protein
MAVHLVTSHGADFFGQDHHHLASLQQIARWVAGWGPTAAAGHELRTLLQSAGTEPHSIPPDAAAAYPDLLLCAVRTNAFPEKAAPTARLLADAAARAAADREPWAWTPAPDSDHGHEL